MGAVLGPSALPGCLQGAGHRAQESAACWVPWPQHSAERPRQALSGVRRECFAHPVSRLLPGFGASFGEEGNRQKEKFDCRDFM